MRHGTINRLLKIAASVTLLFQAVCVAGIIANSAAYGLAMTAILIVMHAAAAVLNVKVIVD